LEHIQLTKSTCVHCRRFTYDTRSKEAVVVMAQLQALSYGVADIADELSQQVILELNNPESNLNGFFATIFIKKIKIVQKL
jgi:hypothetical protein